jgi:uncharacterized protein (DUF1778 family)
MNIVKLCDNVFEHQKFLALQTLVRIELTVKPPHQDVIAKAASKAHLKSSAFVYRYVE